MVKPSAPTEAEAEVTVAFEALSVELLEFEDAVA